MAEQTNAAVSSPAEVADPFNGEQPTLAEYSRYRADGELPERFKPAVTEDPATSQEQEPSSEGEQPESAGESETPQEHQEQPRKGKTAEDRIAQLEATIEKIRRGAGLERKTEPAPVAQPQAKPQPPQSYQEWEQQFSPENWLEGYLKQNPNASYEKANAAMFSLMLNVREQFRSREDAQRTQAKQLESSLADARERYEDFDTISVPTVQAIMDPQIPLAIKEMVNDSEVLPDLIYTLSDEKTLAEFTRLAKTSPTKAARYIAALEAGITEELASGETKPAEKAPEPKKTNAPKPPAPVGGSSSRAFDVSDESLSPEEWARKRNAQLAKR